MPTVTFLPSGVSIEVRAGTTVFAAAAKAEVAVPSQCGGKCACALCRVKVVDGASLISPMKWEEEAHMGNAFFLTAERLSCQLQIFGDVVIEVPDAPAKEKERGRYIPYSLIRKREKMEQEEEMRRVRGEDNKRPPRRRKRPPIAAEGRPDGDRRDRRPHEARPKDSRPKDARPEDSRPPQVRSEDAPLKAARPDEARPKPSGPDEARPKPSRPDEARPKPSRRRRNPGAPRVGDHRPPPGKSEG